MCGIAGYLAFTPEAADPTSLRRMADALGHRGPDDTGIEVGAPQRAQIGGDMRWFESPVPVGLAHRRLSILDLSPSGHQPMTTDDGRYRLTYNGEVYNYVELRGELVSRGYHFRSGTDTEVVLAAYAEWGTGCVERFNGMFAFAIWDAERRELFCARDHLGIKPFHYALLNGAFYFASETPALLRAAPADSSIDPDAFLAYLHCMYVPYPDSIVAGVRKLPPATWMIVRADGSISTKEFWRVSKFDSAAPADAAEQFRALLDDAVRLQTRSDVPIATFLSGGLDSSLIVSLLHRQGVSPIHTFSVGYEGHSIDERPFARQVAAAAGSDHHELTIGAADLAGGLHRAIDTLPEPLADSAMVPTFLLSEWARSFGIKVVLNGTGGDEIFGGYSRYLPAGIGRQVIERMPAQARRTLGRIVSASALIPGLRMRFRSADLVGSIAGNLEFVHRYFADRDATERYCARLESETSHAYLAPGPNARRYQKMHFDLKYYLVDDLLMLLDAMGMAVGLEGRVPLLDVRLVEFLYSLPEALHFRDGLKSFAKQSVGDLLPPSIVHRHKMGFGAPVPFWTRTLLPEIRATLADRGSFVRTMASDHAAFSRFVERETPAEGDLWMLFRLYAFERWHRHVFLAAREDSLRHHSYA